MIQAFARLGSVDYALCQIVREDFFRLTNDKRLDVYPIGVPQYIARIGDEFKVWPAARHDVEIVIREVK